MHATQQRLNSVKNKVKEICSRKQLKIIPEIVAVSKTFSFNDILPLIEIGHNHFGENKIQEAEKKWINIKNKFPLLQLHMLGIIQTNKAKKAVKLFDYIHSLDNFKLAEKIYMYQKEFNRNIKIFIQVNLSNEKQKSGVDLNNLNNFYNYCTNEISLNIIGLMCLPPIHADPNEFFKKLKTASDNLKLKDLSMGMSGDYEDAILNGSTYLRLGTVILGKRNS